MWFAKYETEKKENMAHPFLAEKESYDFEPVAGILLHSI
jgi:hypothetical protein